MASINNYAKKTHIRHAKKLLKIDLVDINCTKYGNLRNAMPRRIHLKGICKMDGMNYELLSLRNLGTQNGWDQFELVFLVQNSEFANGEIFAKMIIHISVWNGKPSPSQNCVISLSWKTIRDEHGNLLEKERDTWAYSDFLQIPFTVDFKSCEKLGRKLAEKFLPGRLDLRRSLQNATDEVSRLVA